MAAPGSAGNCTQGLELKHRDFQARHPNSPLFALLLAFGALVSCSAPDNSEFLEEARSALAADEPRTALIHVHNLLRHDPDHVEARLLRADIALALDDGALAEKDLLRAQTLGVPPGEVVVRLGKAMLLQDAFDRLIADVHTGAAPDTQARAEILLMRGDAYLGLGRLDSAEQAFRDAADADPDSPYATAGMGRVAFARGDTDTALSLLTRALAAAPGDPEIMRAHARFHLDAGNLESARDAYLETLQAEPVTTLRYDSFATLSGLFETYMRLGEADKAEALAADALAAEPGHPLAHYLLGEHALRTDRKRAAAEHLQRTLSAFPNHLGALSQMGALSLEEGKLDAAEGYLRRALSIDEDNTQLRMQLARTMLLRREGDRALEALAPLMGGDQAPELLALAGAATRLSTDNARWLRFFEQAAATAPDNPEWQLELARAYLAAGAPDKSLEVLATVPRLERLANAQDRLFLEAWRRSGNLEAALEAGARLRSRNPGNTAIELLIGELYLETGDLEAARAIMDRALDADSTSMQTLLYAGKVEIRGRRFDEAESFFHRAYTLQPDNLKAIASLAVLAQRRGDMGGAIDILEAARITNPDSLMPLVGLVSFYLHEDDVNQAYEIAQRAIDLRPDDPRALLALGVTQMRREEYRQAIETLKEASLRSPDSALVYAALARAYTVAGVTRDALLAMRRAIRLAPDQVSYAIAAIELNLSLKQFDEAGELARQIIEDDPGNADAHRLLGVALSGSAKHSEAAAAFARATALEPREELVIQQFRALVRSGSGNPERVLTDWLATHADHWRVRLTLAGLLHRNGRLLAAIEHYTRILEAVPDNALVLNNLALAYDAIGDARALETAERAHRLSPHVGAFTDTLGWLLVRKGETARGNALLREAVQQMPSNPEIRYHLAAGLAQSGEVEEARLLLTELVDSGKPFDGLAQARTLLDRL